MKLAESRFNPYSPDGDYNRNPYSPDGDYNRFRLFN